ncbi:MAG: hypothetical protein GTO53_07535 [Planctomycetales bacterium]|nr:hypothetical protein [Planctomycetales bacterium]NIM08988.1 hypothetical protein [Planctomycetales bacterium]NIN08451.1 hypothetical protein [Planctomycetales bacterium]NIN77585.1 hypothetical protein [Planctomycetales bacterium]NIO34750.1 hypothetical protein [Planctomycetales bacterium]
MSRGQLAILGMVGIALLAAGFGLWWRHVQTRQALKFWGPAAAKVIAEAQRVEAMWIQPWVDRGGVGGEPPHDFLQVGPQKYAILAAKEVSDAPGFLNARHALTLGQSFDWQADPAGCRPSWRHAIRFSSPPAEVTILVDFHCQRVRRADAEQTAGIGPIAAGLRAVLNEQLPHVSGSDNNSGTDDSGDEHFVSEFSKRKE